MRRKLLNSMERLLLTAELEAAFWATTIQNRPEDQEFLTELVVLEEDIKSGRFPYQATPCNANLGKI